MAHCSVHLNKGGLTFQVTLALLKSERPEWDIEKSSAGGSIYCRAIGIWGTGNIQLIPRDMNVRLMITLTTD